MERRMQCWLRCGKCGAKELLLEGTKFDGGCLHCGGGPRFAESADGAPMVVWSGFDHELTQWNSDE